MLNLVRVSIEFGSLCSCFKCFLNKARKPLYVKIKVITLNKIQPLFSKGLIDLFISKGDTLKLFDSIL